MKGKFIVLVIWLVAFVSSSDAFAYLEEEIVAWGLDDYGQLGGTPMGNSSIIHWTP